MAEKYGEHPAFPVVSDEFGHFSGMSLRDYFAGQELSAYRDSPNGILGKLWGYLWLGPPLSYEETAEDCYAMADAMLEARDG